MSFIYDIAFVIFAIFYLPFALLKGKRLHGLSIRLGVWPSEIKDRLSDRCVIWVHAVSVGEITTAGYLLRELKAHFPKYAFLITTVTDKGYEVARKLFPEDSVGYLPFDISFIVKMALSRMNLKALVIFETELWPNLISGVHKKGTPIFLVNGRISDNSYRKYLLVKFLLRGVLNKIDRILMQSDEDARRMLSIGAPGKRVSVAGNMKFDMDEPLSKKASIDELGEHLASNNRILFVAGSTHPGEEEMLLASCRDLREEFPSLQLLLAPRHIQRCVEIERLVAGFGFEPRRISQLNEECYESNVVFLLDTVGELKHIYALADIVFVGGSLVDFGGHNIIEPAYFAKPILIGPHMSNFKAIADSFLKDRAVIAVDGVSSLKNALHEFLQDVEVRNAVGLRARGVIERNRGAAHKTAEEIRRVISGK